MIIGTGIDLVDINRIERLLETSGEAFIKRVFTQGEQATAEGRKERAATYAKRFAAKEACAKALGMGIGEGAAFLDIEVVNDAHGAPLLVLHEKALKRLHALLPRGHKGTLWLSLTDEFPYAQAHVIIEAVPA